MHYYFHPAMLQIVTLNLGDRKSGPGLQKARFCERKIADSNTGQTLVYTLHLVSLEEACSYLGNTEDATRRRPGQIEDEVGEQ